MDEDIDGMSFKHFFVFVTTESNATSESNFHPCTLQYLFVYFFLSQCILPQVAITIWTAVTSVGRVYCMLINIIIITKEARVEKPEGMNTF